MLFLREQRRIELIQNLVKLSMPIDLARGWAGYSDNLIRLDCMLSEVCNRLNQHSAQIIQATKNNDEQRRLETTTLLKAGVLIFSAYSAEIFQRGLPMALFPRTNKAIGKSIQEIARSNGALLSALGVEGHLFH